MIKTSVYIFISVFLGYGLFAFDHLVLDSLQAKLSDPEGVRMNLVINQDQEGESWHTEASIQILNEKQFIYIADDQIIKVDQDTIYTFDLYEKNLVIDQYFRDDFTMFTLLSGDFKNIDVTNVGEEQRSHRVDFTIKELDISGSMWISKYFYNPEKISFEDGGSNIQILINSFTSLSGLSDFTSFDEDDWEVIDLRE
jgi:outer membrane lipoprotein-sorting protein